MRNGYFSNNPLGLWTHVWVSYTPRAFNTSEGRKTLEDLRKRNGLALDGTPIIKTLSELDELFSKGLAAKRLRNPDGSEGRSIASAPSSKTRPTAASPPTSSSPTPARRTAPRSNPPSSGTSTASARPATGSTSSARTRADTRKRRATVARLFSSSPGPVRASCKALKPPRTRSPSRVLSRRPEGAP